MGACCCPMSSTGLITEKSASQQILVLGASLMMGYVGDSSSGKCTSPPEHLKILLEQNDSSVKLDIASLAVPGMTTMDVLHTFLSSKRYIAASRIAIVLCGTNDLGYGARSPESIFETLQQIFSEVHQHSPGCHVIATTIPPIGFQDKRLDQARTQLNTLIQEWPAKNPSPDKKISVLDLYSLLPYDHDTPRWSSMRATPSMFHEDGIHYSPNGYAHVGKLYYEHVLAQGCL